MRQAVARDIRLYNNICYINELMHEQHSSLENGSSLLHIPLFVFLHFLEFLCYKNIESTTAQTTLNELQALVHHDQGLYVCDRYRDISWQILGRCHQIIGNFSDAHYSYQQSQYQFNGIQVATLMKIQEIS